MPREDAECFWCGALERHRFVWLYFNKMTDLFDGSDKNMLHVAPEPFFEQELESRFGEEYITADLFDPRAKVKMDITDIQYPDASFDVIYCSHVLEHVPDDKKAMREFYRVLKPDGWAILLVPVLGEKTIENPEISDPSERKRLFGRIDHVRQYGTDYADRLRETKFNVKIFRPSDFLTDDERVLFGITDASEEIYYCTK